MARKGWTTLSAQYRQRLEKAGISRSDYEQGRSLSKARGHERTPEHPAQVNPQKHATYLQDRQNLIRRLEAKKQRMFGSSPRWDATKSRKNVRNPKVSNQNLKKALAMTDEELLDALRTTPATFFFAGYR